MNPLDLYQAYVRERRTQVIPGFALEVLPYLSRHTATEPGGEGMVLFADLPPSRENAVIAQQLAHFDRLNQPFEWKVYELDRPAGLKHELETLGFTSGDEEAFLVFPLSDPFPMPPLQARVRIERITDSRGIDDIVDVQWTVWKWNSELLRDRLARGLQRGETSIYCAYVDDRPVGTGWLDFTPGFRFADLHGGSVLPEFRGRGIFSALLYRRLQDAKERGYAYLAVDAAPMSRPILVKKGFRHLCMTYPMRRSPNPS
jgi:GNAT superfamily N-acetyltransferase